MFGYFAHLGIWVQATFSKCLAVSFEPYVDKCFAFRICNVLKLEEGRPIPLSQLQKCRKFTHLGLWIQATVGQFLSFIPNVDKSFVVENLNRFKVGGFGLHIPISDPSCKSSVTLPTQVLGFRQPQVIAYYLIMDKCFVLGDILRIKIGKGQADLQNPNVGTVVEVPYIYPPGSLSLENQSPMPIICFQFGEKLCRSEYFFKLKWDGYMVRELHQSDTL